MYIRISDILLFQKSSNIFVKRQPCQFLNNEMPDLVAHESSTFFYQIKTPIYQWRSKEIVNFASETQNIGH
jgi:hypothetical protein